MLLKGRRKSKAANLVKLRRDKVRALVRPTVNVVEGNRGESGTLASDPTLSVTGWDEMDPGWDDKAESVLPFYRMTTSKDYVSMPGASNFGVRWGFGKSRSTEYRSCLLYTSPSPRD